MARKKQIELVERLVGAEENSAAKLNPAKLRRFRDIAARMYHTPVLSVKETAYPGIAHLGRKMSEQINSTYRTFFFVSVLRLDMVYVTLILTLIGIWDILNNPLMGIAYDKTRTRWGKARPYAFLAPIFYFGSTAVLFCGRLFFDNDATDDPSKILFVFVLLFIQETFSTIFTIPVDNMVTLMSPNPKDRMNIGLIQTYMMKWGGDFVAALIMPLLDIARRGYLPISPGVVFAGFGIVTAAIGLGGSLFMSVGCRERIMLQPQPAPTSKALFYILKNKYELRKFVADFLGSWWNKGSYAWDVVTQLEIFGGVLRTMPFYMPRNIVQIVSLGLVEPFKRLFGGSFRKTVLFMRATDFVMTTASALIGSRPKVVGTWWKVGLVFAVFDGVCVSNDAPSTVLENEINREIGDYTEYMTGERPDGTIGLLTGLIKKTTEPLRALMTIAVFRWSGYDPSIGEHGWSQEMVSANVSMYSKVFLLYNIADIIPNILNAIPLFFYDIEGKKKIDMYLALNERRAVIAKEAAEMQEMEALAEILAEEEMTEGKQ
ncbi:MAG: MFS transporter [Oscillospiraceae bacterium]|jgi:Na+/melibiose symporter-like transporter|nr:MFS transporter [Oscillospiraceae bacterium]